MHNSLTSLESKFEAKLSELDYRYTQGQNLTCYFYHIAYEEITAKINGNFDQEFELNSSQKIQKCQNMCKKLKRDMDLWKNEVEKQVKNAMGDKNETEK